MQNYFQKEYDIVKFVRVNGQYRFTHLMNDHINLVKNGEKAESAGFVQYDTNKDGKRFMSLLNESSMTLNYLGPEDVDGPAIASLLGYELRN